MNKAITIVLLIICQTIFGQNKIQQQDIIELAKIYKENHVYSPTIEVFLKLDSIQSTNLRGAKDFIKELILDNNAIATSKYLTKPDSSTLWILYVIRGLTWNMFKVNATDSNYGLDSLLNENIGYNEQLANYYNMLFASILNKNRPFDMSNINFDMEQYGLSSNVEKGIFFLESMDALGILITGYFYVNPPNYAEASTFINKYPKYNDNQYYKYLDLDFEDFAFTFSSTEPKGSFKKYQLNKYMNTILCHVICLSQDKEKVDEMKDVLLNSIIHDYKFWQFSETPETFKRIYKK